MVAACRNAAYNAQMALATYKFLCVVSTLNLYNSIIYT